jgi:hypothetical protein
MLDATLGRLRRRQPDACIGVRARVGEANPAIPWPVSRTWRLWCGMAAAMHLIPRWLAPASSKVGTRARI